MLKLFDRAFFKFLAGFVIILAVSFSILALSGSYREVGQYVAAFFRSLSGQ